MTAIYLALLTSALGADPFPVRERAESLLAAAWPASRAALAAAERSADPEVRARARAARFAGERRSGGRHWRTEALAAEFPEIRERAAWLFDVQADLVRREMVVYALADKSGKRLLALWLVLAPFPENDGAPWAPSSVHRAHANDRELRQALCDLANHIWRWPGDDHILLDCDPALDDRYPGRRDYMSGLNNVRFWARGLPDPTNWWTNRKRAAELWALAKCPHTKETTAVEPPKGDK